MLNKPSNFTYATTLFLITGYYNISLTNAEKKICTITTPFINYEYNCLPMGVYLAPDVFQDKISTLMDDLEFVRVYLKDFLIIVAEPT